MTVKAADKTRKRNRSFEESHRSLLDIAAKLVAEKGSDSLSVAALARAAGMDRTSIYYHFKSRDELLEAVQNWSSEQIAAGFQSSAPQKDRIDHISRFVLENPELVKIWIERFVNSDDIRDNYPNWDALVSGISSTEELDSEVFSTLLITGAIIGPHIFRHAVSPDVSDDEIVERFRKEHQRLLKNAGLLIDSSEEH